MSYLVPIDPRFKGVQVFKYVKIFVYNNVCHFVFKVFPCCQSDHCVLLVTIGISVCLIVLFLHLSGSNLQAISQKSVGSQSALIKSIVRAFNLESHL